MNFLRDVITYVRRIIKSPSDAEISDNLIIDYINRFWIMDVDARMQLFDLKTTYQFQTVPGRDRYNMPLYNIQIEPGSQQIASYPVYQGFFGPARVAGVEVPFHTQRETFLSVYPNVVQQPIQVAVGDGTANYSFTIPILPQFFPPNPPNPPIQNILCGHVDLMGIMATGTTQDPPQGNTINLSIPTTSISSAFYITTLDAQGNSIVVADSGQFLTNEPRYGLLMTPGTPPYGNTALPGGYSTTLNTINYLTGEVNVTFPTTIPANTNINVQCYYFQSGLPRSILFYNNTITLRAPPSRQFLVELDAYLSPAAYLSSEKSIPFGYMAEYIARGAARKILSDTGDVEQFIFYEPLFKEQEMMVWKRSQRQFTATRTETLYSRGLIEDGNNNQTGIGI